jgi:hypothetical protein
MIQTADILLYGATEVPAGDEEREGVEITAALARRFNERYGDVFVVPRLVKPRLGGQIRDLLNPERSMGKLSAAAVARKDLASACGGEPGKSLVTFNGKATIPGVSVLDLIYGHGGVAPNGIKLHPVLSIAAASCSRVKP